MGKGEDKPSEPTANEAKKSEPVVAPPKAEGTAKDSSNVKKDDSIRKVIKLGSTEEKPKEDSKLADLGDIVPTEDQAKAGSGSSDSNTRENLEQKRAILQSIKDFDFQIKKNQEDINGINQKLESLSKDLDDLVSLYEIVSEQMNPFVGLSKVTKKRLDALENFTKEIDTLKTRVGDLESFAERTGIKIEDFKALKTDQITMPSNNVTNDLSDVDLDKILERSLKELSGEEEIDKVINEFIESLKNENVNV